MPEFSVMIPTAGAALDLAQATRAARQPLALQMSAIEQKTAVKRAATPPETVRAARQPEMVPALQDGPKRVITAEDRVRFVAAMLLERVPERPSLESLIHVVEMLNKEAVARDIHASRSTPDTADAPGARLDLAV